MTNISTIPCEGKLCFIFKVKAVSNVVEIQSPNNSSCPPPEGEIREMIEQEVDEYVNPILERFENAEAPQGTCKSPCGCSPVGGPQNIDLDYTLRFIARVKECDYIVVVNIRIVGQKWKGKCVKVGVKKPPVDLLHK